MQNRLVIFFITTTPLYASFFFFNDTATTEIYTLSLHDALPISGLIRSKPVFLLTSLGEVEFTNAVQLRVFRKEWTRLEARSVHDLFLQHQGAGGFRIAPLGSEIWEKALVLSAAATWRRSGGRRLLYVRQTRSEEHTSELQSRLHLVCRLLLEKNKGITYCDRQLR